MNIQKMNKWVSFFFQVSIALGTISFLSYCATVDFYPKNVQFGDGILLLLSLTALGILITLSMTVFSISASAFVNTIIILYRLPTFLLKSFSVTKKEKQLRWMVLSGMVNKFIKDNSISSVYLLGLIGLSFLTPLIYCYVSENHLKASEVLTIVICFLYVGVTCKIFGAYKEKTLMVSLVAFAILISPYFVVNHVFSHALLTVMESAGIRNTNVSLLIDKQYLPVVDSVIDDNQLKNYELHRVDDNYARLDHVDVLFGGLGDSTLIRLGDQTRTTSFILPSQSLHLEKSRLNDQVSELITAIQTSGKTVFTQDKVDFDPYQMQLSFHRSYGNFKVGEYEISPKYKRVLISTLQPLLKVLSEHDELIHSVEIIGLSSEEWKGSKDDADAYRYNYDLSVKRALAVSDAIFESPVLKGYSPWLGKKVVIRGELSSKDSESRKVMIKININHDKV